MKCPNDSFWDKYVDCECENINIVCGKCPPGWLEPGDQYNIVLISNRVISKITVKWEDDGDDARGTLFIDNLPFATQPIPDLPGTFTWCVDFPTTESTEAYIEISGGCANIISVEVEYEEEPYIELAPGASFPLPSEPPLVSRVTFEAKTDPGTTSEISLLAFGVPFASAVVTEIPTNYAFDLSTSIPVEDLALTNTGSSTIFIRDVTTQ